MVLDVRNLIDRREKRRFWDKTEVRGETNTRSDYGEHIKEFVRVQERREIRNHQEKDGKVDQLRRYRESIVGQTEKEYPQEDRKPK